MGISLSQLRNSRARAALIRRGLSELFHMRMAREQIRDGFSQSAFAVPMNNPNCIGPRDVGFVQKFIDAVRRFIHGRADDVDLR